MEGSKIREVVVMVVLVLGILAGQSSADFKDCYVKCYVFCLIEPTETVCTCTTKCFKDCIFSPPAAASTQAIHAAGDDQSLNFCKLGCASSLCSNISTKQNPNGQNVENCVGSCSKRCTKTYKSP